MARSVGLTYDGIIAAAVVVADERGLAGVTMRGVARQLGVEAMSLYHHLRDKEALLDGLANWIFTQIWLPELDAPWRAAMRMRAQSARDALAAHPWALGLIESRRSPGADLLRHHDRVLGCLRTNEFSVPQAAHAFSVLDAYVYGFVLTELSLPFEPSEGAEAFVAEIAEQLEAASYPHLAEMIADQVSGKDYRYGDEFDVGLELILDGIAALVDANAQP